MKEIEITRGYVVIVDDEDYEWLSEHKWHAWKSYHQNNVYAIRSPRVHEAWKKKSVRMHREVAERMWGPGQYMVDHKDRNGLNNRRSNLRRATAMNNTSNGTKRINNKSGYKGVCWSSSKGKWIAQIGFDSGKVHIGTFRDPEEASHAYDEVALRLHGDFACVNFPHRGDAA